MTDPISLRLVVDELGSTLEESTVYLDRRTGEFVCLTEEQFRAVERGQPIDSYPDWERPLIRLAAEIEDSPHHVALPTKFDIDEYHVMERFCLSLADPHLQAELLQAIRGAGAFRRFRHAVQDRDLEASWYAFRDDRLADLAREWLQKNRIAFTDDWNTEQGRET